MRGCSGLAAMRAPCLGPWAWGWRRVAAPGVQVRVLITPRACDLATRR